MYVEFANYYDLFMGEAIYEQYDQYLQQLIKKYRVQPQTLLDLGCGTGQITCRLADRGYQVIGIDKSSDMLTMARQRADQWTESQANQPPRSSEEKMNQALIFSCQDITHFALPSPVDMVVSTLDSLNYLPTLSAIQSVFERVSCYLRPGGLFIFDLNTEYRFAEVYGDGVFTDEVDGAYYIWQNTYDSTLKANHYQINFFVPAVEHEALYQMFEEEHVEFCYSIDEIRTIAQGTDLVILDIYQDFSMKKADKQAERVHYILRKKS